MGPPSLSLSLISPRSVTTVNSRRGDDTAFEHIEKMRIVPFDLRSFAELLGRTLGALVALLDT